MTTGDCKQKQYDRMGCNTGAEYFRIGWNRMIHSSTGSDRIVYNEIGKDKIGEEGTRMQ